MEKQPFGNPYDPRYDIKEYIEWRDDNVFTDDFARNILREVKANGKWSDDDDGYVCRIRNEDGDVELIYYLDRETIAYSPPREADYIFINLENNRFEFSG